MKTESPVHPPEDVHRGGAVCELHFLPPEQMESIRLVRVAHWQAYHVAEQLHKERNLAYQRRWGLKRRRRRRAAKMRERAAEARSTYITVISAVAVHMMILVTLARTCERCQGHVQLDGYRELRCLVCGHVEYPGRDIVRPSDVDLRVHNRADKFLATMAGKASFSHIREKAS